MIGLYSELFSPENDSSAPIINQRYANQISILLQGVFTDFNMQGKVFCLSGGSGYGKTTLINRLCCEDNIRIIQFDPYIDSEFTYEQKTNQTSILTHLQNFLQKSSLHNPHNTLLVIDGISIGQSEVQEFCNILRSTKIPVCWILSPELAECRSIPFPHQKLMMPKRNEIKNLIDYVCSKLDIDLAKEDEDLIISMANGDIRTALNSLQLGIHTYRDQQLFIRSKAAQIYRGTELDDDIEESLVLCYDSLHLAYGSADDFINEVEYFSLFDENDSLEDQTIQNILAFSISVNNSKSRFACLMPMNEQFRNKNRDLEYVSVEDKLMFIHQSDQEMFLTEEEEMNEMSSKEMDLIEALKILEIDPIDESEEAQNEIE